MCHTSDTYGLDWKVASKTRCNRKVIEVINWIKPSVDSTKLAGDLSDRSSTHLRLKMERSKTVAFSNTVVTPSVFLSIAVCFVGLIHVEIELYAHREMLRVLNHQSEEKVELPNTVRVSRTLHSGLSGGEL